MSRHIMFDDTEASLMTEALDLLLELATSEARRSTILTIVEKISTAKTTVPRCTSPVFPRVVSITRHLRGRVRKYHFEGGGMLSCGPRSMEPVMHSATMPYHAKRISRKVAANVLRWSRRAATIGMVKP